MKKRLLYYQLWPFFKQIASSFKKRGFIMVEVAVVVGIISVMSIILADISISPGRLFSAESAKNDLQLQGVRVINGMGKIIKLADQVVATKTINSKNYTTSGQTIILRLPSVDSEGKVINEKYDYAVFYLDSQNEKSCLLSLEPDPLSSRALIEKLLSDSCQSLRFIYDEENYEDVSSVMVELTLSKDVFARVQSFSLNRKINLRNKKI